MKHTLKTLDSTEKKSLIWLLAVFTSIFTILSLLGSVTIYVDPFFHYHSPRPEIKYELDLQDERNINDGILRHFEYEALITGTSMTENFKTSDCEELFGYKTVKVPYSGGNYNEIDKLVKRAFTSDNEIKMVIRSMDLERMTYDKDVKRSEVDANNVDYVEPSYLMNNNYLDDVKYVWNKTILFNRAIYMLDYTKAGYEFTSFDDYAYWSPYYEYGVKSLFESVGPEKKWGGEKKNFTDQDRERIRENLIQNVINTANEHPETEFYYFITPYSVCWWGQNKNSIDYWCSVQDTAIQEVLGCNNIKLYSYCDDESITCDLNNYKDIYHYGGWVNSKILVYMKDGKGLITTDNYKNYLERIRDLYSNYDYDGIFEGIEEEK